MTKRVYNSVIDAVGVRGRPPVRWEDRVVEYVRERGERGMRGVEHTRRECKDKIKWTLLSWPSPEGSS